MKKFIFAISIFSLLCMAQANNSPNMNLPIPVVGQTSGPQWASDINASLTLIDQHNHTPGFGVQIPPAGLNINTNLSFNNNSATSMQASVYTPQGSYSTNYGVHVEGVDLYFVDGNGVDVRLTSGGTVNATSSGISSGTATASFSAGVLVVNSASNTPANIQAASYLMGNNVANSKYLTLQPPNSMAANYSLTMPLVPASQSFMTIDTSGNLAGYASINQGISRANQVAVGQQISSSSGSFVTSSTTYVAVTNLSVTITTSGRPVMIMLVPDGTASAPFIGAASTASFNNPVASIQIDRDSAAADYLFLVGELGTPSGGTLSISAPVSSVQILDAVSSGTHTYIVNLKSNNASATATIAFTKLVAYEL